MSDLSRRQYAAALRFYRFRHVTSILAVLGATTVVLTVAETLSKLIGA